MKKVFTLLIVLAMLMFTGLTDANAATILVPANQPTIQDAINAASPGDIIQVEATTLTITTQVSVNKANLTIQGVNNTSSKIQVSGTITPLFLVTADGVTIQNLEIEKTDKAGVQNIIGIQASNVTVKNNIIHGQFVFGDGDVSRAIVISGGYSGLLIDNNQFYNLRQPAYVSGVTTGTVSNNHTYNTKGWVLEGGNLTFIGNTWGVNVYDIAILSTVSAINHTDIVAMSNANNGAVIEDQRVSPAVLSVVNVDVSTSFSSDLGGKYHPYSTITPAITRVVNRGTIKVAAGTYNEAISISKTLILKGAQNGVDARNRSGNETVLTHANGLAIAADNVIIDGFTIQDQTGTGAPGWGFAIYMTPNYSGTQLLNNIIKNNIIGSSLANTGAAQAIIKFNWFDSNNRPGPAGGCGIYTDEYVAGGMISNVLIDNNKFTGHIADAGIDFSVTQPIKAASGITITNNKFDGNRRAAFLYNVISSSFSFNTILNSTGAGSGELRIYGGVKDLAVNNNSFTGGASAPEGIRITNDGGFDNLNIPTSGNNFVGYSAAVKAINVVSGYTGNLTAACNWWGTTIASEIAAKLSNNVTYAPFNISYDGACSGNPPSTPITTIGASSSSACNTLDVPVTVRNFKDVGAISLVLNFDPAKLQLLPITGLTSPGVTLHPDLVTLGSAAPSVDNTIGQFRMGDFPVPAITLADDAVLFTLHFNVLSAAVGGTTTNLTWSNVQGECEYAGPGGTPVYTSTFNNNPSVLIPVRPVKNIDTGLDYCTIQAVIDATQTLNGHTITVAAGTYPENLSVYKTLDIRGANYGVSAGYTPGSRVTESVIVGEAVVSITGISFDGFQFDRPAGVGLKKLVRMANAGYTIAFKNNMFDMKDETSSAISSDDKAAVFNLMNNKFMNQRYNATYQGRTVYAKSALCSVTGNVFDDCNHGLYLVSGSNGSIVNGNRFVASGIAVLTGSAPNIQIINNDFVSGGGIYSDATSNLTISNNFFGSGVSYAAWFSNSIGSGNVITNNSILSAYPTSSGPTYAGKTLFNFSTTQTVNATCNWYGSTVPSVIEGKISGLFTIASWLTSGIDDDLVTHGFQPVAGSCNGSPVVITSAVANPITCGETTGEIVVNFSGGVANYTVNWTGGTPVPGVTASPYIITGLAVGTYTVTVTDQFGNSDTETATVENLPVKNATQLTYYPTIQAAIAAAASNDVIEVCAGTFTEIGQIVIDKNLTITGAGKALTTIKPDQNTGNTGDARAWFLVNAGITFNLNQLTLDGSGKLVFQGIRQKGVGAIDKVEFKNIKYNESGPDYSGVAVAAFGNGNVHITNSTFVEIGRVGVLYFGAGITGSNFHNNTYTGKGAGNWLDYMLDISAGAVVDVQGCTVSGNRGVASVDNSTSAGIIVSTYYGAGTKATVSGSTITDNTTGIAVGYDSNDASVVKAENNKIFGNGYGLTSEKAIVDASQNWWGDASGPKNTPENICGSGNEVSAYVTFRPWWTNLAMTVLSTTSGPAEVGGPVAITSTVECVASATAPTVLPLVKDFCGTVLLPSSTSPVRTETITNCEGNVTYTYTYTDVLGVSLVWTYNYIIDRTTAPVVTANSSKTVACPADAVNPALLSTIPDQQQLLVNTGLTAPYWADFTSIGQSFTCGTSGWLTQLDLRVGNLAGAQSFTLQIYQGNGIAGTLLYTGSHSLTATGWQSLNIAQELAPYLTAGTQYTFWLTSFTYNQLGLFCMYPNVYNGGVAMDGCTAGCSPTYAWQQWPNYDLVFKTYMTAVPIVKDVCGTVIPTPTPVESGTYNGCEGTKVYTYIYTDCAGLSSEWKFTYTIERNDFTMPANTTATVACVSNVVVPIPPAVNDNCGNPITPVAGPAPVAPACEGTMVYTWTYKDCENNTHIWKHTVTIDDNVAPVFTTCAPAVTVNMNTDCKYIGAIGTPVATDNCGGTVNYTNNVPVAGLPFGINTVIWTATDCAGNTATCEQLVTVVKNTLNGTLVYNNAAKTPMNLVKMVIKDATNTQVGVEVTTTGAGAFTFPDLCAGTYTIHITDNQKDAGGINATDAAQVNKWSANYGDIEHVKFLAGDVTFNKFIAADDALKIQRYFVFGDVFAAPKWSYWKKGELITSNSIPYDGTPAKPWPTNITVTVAGDVSGLELYGMLSGDFDGSLVPTILKSAEPSLTLAENSNLQIGANQAFELPLRAASAMQVGAVSMILDIPSELVTVKNVKIKGSNDPVMWSINGNELRIGWHSMNPVNVAENGALVTLELITTNAFAKGQSIDIALPFNQLNELADGNFEAMENAELIVAKVGNQSVGNIAIGNDGGLQFSNYPNPFSKVTTLAYNLPVDGKVTINLFNNLGQLVTVLVDAEQTAGQHMFRYESNTLQPGIYVAKLRLVNSETDVVGTIKLSVQK